MAEVFSGHAIGDHGFQKPVAIKRLLPELASDHVFVERLIAEAKILVGMQHGNIVSVLDLARDGDDVFLVMEYVDGPSLRQLLKARAQRGLSLGVTTYIIQAAAAGLEFAHNRPGGAIVHADISPSNLLLTTSGEVRVADFGIARREGGGYGVVEGKWAYMAPEQARGEPLTARSDVFALGVVLYELVTGAHPFGRQVTHEERDSEPMRVIPPRVVKPSIPPGLDAICMTALAHDPRNRYKSMQALIDAIVEERFANQFREGASDLAHTIREIAPQAALTQPRTMVTDRPVTIMTRSLLRELTPAKRASSPRLASQSQSDSVRRAPTPAPVFNSAAQTRNILADDLARAAALLEMPVQGSPIPAFRLSEAVLPGQDLASVVGGSTVTASQHVGVADPGAGSSRWTFGILGAAAVIGVIVAIAMKVDWRNEAEASASTESVAATEPAPAEPVPQETPATPEPTVAPTVEDKATVPPSVEVKPTEPTPSERTVDTSKALEAPAAPDVIDDKKSPAKIAEPRKPTKIRATPVKKETGMLRVHIFDFENPDSSWVWVYVPGFARKESTDAKYTSLPVGPMKIKLMHPQNGKIKFRTVEIVAGQMAQLKMEWEDD